MEHDKTELADHSSAEKRFVRYYASSPRIPLKQTTKFSSCVRSTGVGMSLAWTWQGTKIVQTLGKR